jgi:hypothetical protein
LRCLENDQLALRGKGDIACVVVLTKSSLLHM